MQDLDIVQSAELVKTNHCFAYLIMNEYAYSGQGHTIHSSGQLNGPTTLLMTNFFQVGGKQRIITIVGYIMPLASKEEPLY